MMGACEKCDDLVDIDPYYVPLSDGTLPIDSKPILCGYTKCLKGKDDDVRHEKA